MPSATCSERPGGRLRRALLLIALALVARTALLHPAHARAACDHGLEYYGTYSVGTSAGVETVPLATRLRELSDLGANLVVATGSGTDILRRLPTGMRAVPGCGLMKKKDWQHRGHWSEIEARTHLAKLAAKFAHDRRVFGICLTQEVTQYASHTRRVWMYRLAKEYFPDQKVIQHYGVLYDRENPAHHRVYAYGRYADLETDVLFVSLPAVRHGRFNLRTAHRLDEALAAAARTPGVPVWGYTSINADSRSVTGPESMVDVWGARGENMKVWAARLLDTVHTDAAGQRLRLTGFFWRSLGRFPYDLGYPAFAPQRAEMRAIGGALCPGS